ncbi:DUF2867 domain-containing protein [Roseovarius sp. A21]|uniref:DUF2867 domain-containing protein n=1 Tax=Roseovarius bejariae TaxID=2576383 RepID=A0A844D671_9RHOB|nr:DUF2867 domain-containing protein [Roseovarius bejariae]MRU16858.1 DUF2867 domain-containing protein [Roseovarius bejariae]
MITLPNTHIRVLAPVPALDYYDSQSINLPHPVRPLEAWALAMADPQPLMQLAFRIRDAISSCFGVKKIGGFSGKTVTNVEPGDHLDFFLVEYIDQTALVLTERDRHLDVMTCISCDGPTVSITSSVRIHNWFGRAYMIPVGIAHKWIVHGTLKRLASKLSPKT